MSRNAACIHNDMLLLIITSLAADRCRGDPEQVAVFNRAALVAFFLRRHGWRSLQPLPCCDLYAITGREGRMQEIKIGRGSEIYVCHGISKIAFRKMLVVKASALLSLLVDV